MRFLIAGDERGLLQRTPVVDALTEALAVYGGDISGDGVVKLEPESIDYFVSSADGTAVLHLFSSHEKQETPLMLLTLPVYESYRTRGIFSGSVVAVSGVQLSAG